MRRSEQGRRHPKDHYWDGKRTKFCIAIGMAFLMLQCLFVVNLSYIYGSVFQSADRVHNLKILYVDYDDGVIGASVQAAYKALKAKSFPTLESHTAAEYPTVDSLRKAVCQGTYWAAAYVHRGASTRLANALNGSSASYNASNTVTYIWNEARYPVVEESYIEAKLVTLFAASTSAFYQLSGANLSAVDALSPIAINALLGPISATSVNLHPTEQGSRVFYNTISIVMPVLQQFFFIMALNGITLNFGLLENLTIKSNGLIRAFLAFTYTLVAALCTAGYVFAFDEHWANQGGTQYILTALTYWLYMHINFLLLDVMTAFVPMSIYPFCVLTYAITSAAATVEPFELTPDFYHWQYAYPSHEAYEILVQIWSHGCYNRLYRTLPILFSWIVVGLAGAIAANRYRCNKVRNMSKQRESTEEAAVVSSEKFDPGSQIDTSQSEIRNEDSYVLGPSYPQPFQNTLFRTSENTLHRTTTV